jgi:hypothetical protein
LLLALPVTTLMRSFSMVQKLACRMSLALVCHLRLIRFVFEEHELLR